MEKKKKAETWYEEHGDKRFYKFPRTPHLAGSEVVDDDEVVDQKTLMTALSLNPDLKIIVQEKMDGTNVSLYFEEEWVAVPQKRAGLIGTGEKPQYDVFRNWVYENLETLFSITGTEYVSASLARCSLTQSLRYVLFGEWLWCKHAVKYDALPAYFLAFDLMEKDTGKFLSYDRLVEKVDGKVKVVPFIWSGSGRDTEFQKSISEEMLKKKSAHGSEQAEGVYMRLEEGGYVVDRFKLRRKTFNSGRAGFTTHIVNNDLKDDVEK